jgi:hypothetical protein
MESVPSVFVPNGTDVLDWSNRRANSPLMLMPNAKNSQSRIGAKNLRLVANDGKVHIDLRAGIEVV